MSRGELSYLCQGKVLSFGSEDTLKIIPSLNFHLMDANIRGLSQICQMSPGVCVNLIGRCILMIKQE